MRIVDVEATGENIRVMMASRGLTARDIAEACGLTTRNAVYRWIQGNHLPSIDNLVILTGIFAVSMEDIVAVREIADAG